MAPTFKFDCFRSIADGWVATGTVQGVKGGSFEERPVWFGCQGATWQELQTAMGKLVEVLKPRLDEKAMTVPVEAFVKPWPEHQPLLLPPLGNASRLFDNLVSVGTRRRAWVENADEVHIVSFLKIGALAIFRPTGFWKPELVSSFLGFAIGLVPEKPTPIPERAGQTSADLVEEILLGGGED
jgi:hypothetical protein